MLWKKLGKITTRGKTMNELGKPRVGLLPLMLEMYKIYAPDLIKKQQLFVDIIAQNLRKFSNVVVSEISTNRKEVYKAVKIFDEKDVDVIIIIFVSYATSISILKPLLDTTKPILLLSTAPRSSMADGITMDDIMENHGVHGYMDLANVLKRNGRDYVFVSGKKDDEKMWEYLKLWIISSRVKGLLSKSTIGIAGYTFDGMGDFGVDTTFLNSKLGIEVKHLPLNEIADFLKSIDDKEIIAEIEKDKKEYNIDPSVDDEIHSESNRFYLALKKLLNERKINAFTMHFQGILENPKIKTVPFLAISKLQKEGLAYAGEGDIIGTTMNLISRFLNSDTVFTEIFCPDFDGERLLMGHMGESNPALGVSTVLRRKKFAFGKALDPVIADVTMKEGEAILGNLAVVGDNKFQMVLSKGRVCKKIKGSSDIDMPYFHFKPDVSLPNFLTKYGYAGGTHHFALMYGNKVEELKMVANILNISVVTLE